MQQKKVFEKFARISDPKNVRNRPTNNKIRKCRDSVKFYVFYRYQGKVQKM